MLKKILTLLIIPALIFCGCSVNSQEATLSEYSEAMEEAYELYYVKGGYGTVRLFTEKIADPSSVSPDIEGIFAGIEQAFETIESIKPPKQYDEIHGKLLSKIEYERELAALERKALESKTRDEFNENWDLAYRSDFEFPDTFLELHLKLNDSYDPIPNME